MSFFMTSGNIELAFGIWPRGMLQDVKPSGHSDQETSHPPAKNNERVDIYHAFSFWLHYDIVDHV